MTIKPAPAPGAISRRGFLTALAPSEGARQSAEANAPAVACRTSKACLEELGVACRRCAEVCDPEAIAFRPQRHGHARLAISVERCNGCAVCRDVCPVEALGLANRDRQALAVGLAQLAADTPSAAP